MSPEFMDRLVFAAGRKVLEIEGAEPKTDDVMRVELDGDPEAREHMHALVEAIAGDLYRELDHLVRLLEPELEAGRLQVPGLATLNGAKRALGE